MSATPPTTLPAKLPALAVALVALLGCAQLAAPEAARAQTEVLTPVPIVGSRGAGRPALPDDMNSARGLAMGLGARASAGSTSGLYLNPAALNLGRPYHVESQATWEPSQDRGGFGATVVDGYSGPVALGVGYRYLIGNGRDGHGGMSAQVGLATALGDALSVGVTGRYLSYWRENSPEGTQPWAEGFTMDGAIRLSPIPGLHIAALAYNFIDLGTPFAPIQVGGSASYTIERMVTLAFDMLADLSTFRNNDASMRPEALIGGAAELAISEFLIRAGYLYDTGRDLHYVSGGAGWQNANLAIEAGLRQQVVEPYATWVLASFIYKVH